MQVIKVVWKDSQQPSTREYIYRKQTTQRFYDGWITNVPGDDNVYKYQSSALNAIDAFLGGEPQKTGGKKRIEQGIQIIGKIADFEKDDETA